MNRNISQLELLPNEILTDLFYLIHPQDLFRAFNNLNSRFNTLLRSLNHLSLTLSTCYYNEDDFCPYIRTLIINRAVDTNLNHFTKIRHLILRYPTDKLLGQLNANVLPHMEYLSVNHMHISVINHIPNLYDKIFSNNLPNLKSCSLVEWSTITEIQQWSQSPSLRVLKVGTINLFICKAILSSCPNLYFLQLGRLTSSERSFHIKPHMILKRLIIKTDAFVQPWNEFDVNSCLLYVPNLEYLSVHRSDMMLISKFDWLASMVTCHLPLLRRFYFYCHIFSVEVIDPEILVTQIQEKFKNVHHNGYQSKLIIHRA
jgi:hypothetical protein